MNSIPARYNTILNDPTLRDYELRGFVVTNDDYSSALTRRRFLRAVLAGSALVGAGALLNSCGAPSAGTSAPATANTTPLKIGLLVPSSDIYAVLGASITQGMQIAFAQVGNEAGGRPIEIISEDEGTKPDLALQKARKLVEQDQVALVAGVVSSGVANALRDYFHDGQKLLVLANAGANALARKAKSPYIFRASFSNWQSNWQMGTWAAANIGKRAMLSAPDYAAGKEMLSAFRNSFEAAGGEVVQVQLTPFPNIGDPAPFMAQIRDAAADFVYAFYSGAASVAFVKAYSDFGLAQTVPLAGVGFLVEQDVLPQLASAALNIRSALHWAAPLDNPENKAFTTAYQKLTNQQPNVFAVQGYDAARLIIEGVNAVQGDVSQQDILLKALGAATFASPRGPFKLDPNTNNPINPCYVREVRQAGSAYTNVVIAMLEAAGDPGDDSKDTPVA
ncbi:MAG: ABC transporter substrate-binding protein [Roseiflexaceae bacterium]|nr:ABC transporter substrate-binding protein [Roseiflexaceae bacterium]